MGKTYIADTADVVFRRKSDGHVVFTAEAQLAGLTSSAESEIIRGGIGNMALYQIRHSKGNDLTVRNATFSLEYLAMTQGVAVQEDGTAVVSEVEKGLKVEDDGGSLKVTIKGTPIESTVTVINARGESDKAVVTTNTVDIQTGFAEEGEKVTVVYKTEVTGNVVNIDADKFSEGYEVQYKTIEYDTVSNKVVKDIYFIFDNAVPASDFEMQLENGTAYTPELTFTAMADPDTRQIGRIVEVER